MTLALRSHAVVDSNYAIILQTPELQPGAPEFDSSPFSIVIFIE
jgi:hypothetical protein